MSSGENVSKQVYKILEQLIEKLDVSITKQQESLANNNVPNPYTRLEDKRDWRHDVSEAKEMLAKELIG